MYTVESGPWQCPTVGGRKTFEVRGDVESGVKIRIGSSGQPLSFDKSFFADLLTRFRGREVRIGSKFDDPGPGSLGEWIQQKRGVKMNPAVYVAGLLVRLGYAEYSRRGYIRFFMERREVESPPRRQMTAAPSADSVRSLVHRVSQMSSQEAQEVLDSLAADDTAADPLARLRGNPNYKLPDPTKLKRRNFEPQPLKGRPLSEDIIRDRR